ncbi:MAG: hypothetical protein LBF22_06730 [Deltaproteobacteria bacterium]|nr:hypothetical protein [Deltaproteobacteria bacterium]
MFTKAANAGVSGTQVKLGILSKIGFGIPERSETATNWSHKAAELGNIEAFVHLAAIGNEEIYSSEELEVIGEALIKSAGDENPFAQFNLALKLQKDPFQNPEEVDNWFNSGSEQGDLRAREKMRTINSCYLTTLVLKTPALTTASP